MSSSSSSSCFFVSMQILLVICLVSPCAAVASVSGSGRLILRDIADGSKEKVVEKPDYAVDLNATSFDKILKDTPATFAIVEFFAHWCPACRNYKQHYEKVASLFNGPDAVHPGILFMARVDCASKQRLFEWEHVLHWLSHHAFMNQFQQLFTLFDMRGIAEFFSSWDPKQKKNELRPVDDGRTADRLLNWINKQLGSSYTLKDEKFKNDILTNASDPIQIARAIYDVEEATSTAFDIILSHKMIKSETRASLLKFLQILAAHHPSRRCRKGTAEMLINFDDIYPPKMLTKELESVTDGKKGPLQSTDICGKEVPRGYWMFCRGSRNDTRGYSCGLWVLLHSLSVRVDDGESQMAFLSVCDFIHNFFICEECRQHFYEMCSGVTTPFGSAPDFVLWLWDAHNKVNERLMGDEASLGTADPEHPKILWPSKRLCPTCYAGESQKPVEWNKDEVLNFLVSYYGAGLVGLHKDKQVPGESRRSVAEHLPNSTNAVGVPVSAAFVLLAVSCTVAALACFWRSRRRNRRYKHQQHPLKNI